MLVLSSSQVEQALTPESAFNAMKTAFLTISGRLAKTPPRVHLPSSSGKATTLVMPAYCEFDQADVLSVKVVSIVDANLSLGLPRVVGALLVLDGQTGQPIGLLDGATVTAIRTAAASAVATDLLARGDAQTLGIIGAGVLARHHIKAICRIRPITEVQVYSRTQASVERLMGEIGTEFPVTIQSSPNRVAECDIVCTVTSSRSPVFEPGYVQPGTHLNAVGSYQPQVAEIPGSVVAGCRIYVDQLEAAMEEAGDILQPIQSGLMDESRVIGEMGDLLAGRIIGRSQSEDITLFKSVGNSIQDCAAGHSAIVEARRLGLGCEVAF